MILIEKFPIAPSDNAAFAHVPGQALKRPTAAMAAFKSNVFRWQIQNREIVSQANLVLLEWDTIRVQYSFFLPRRTLITQKGQIKRWDVTNFIKHTQDALAGALGFDDKIIFSASCEKLISEDGPFCCAIIENYPVAARVMTC